MFDKLEADLAKAMLSIPAAKVFGSAPVLRRRGYAARNTTMHLKFAAEKSGRKRTTQAASRVGSAMAKTFTFVLRLSRPQRLRSSRKPLPAQNSKPTLSLADATIRAFFHEQCR